MPDAVGQIRVIARILGNGMLYLHLLTLLPRRPGYTVASLSLLAVVLAVHYGPGYGSDSFGSRFSIPAIVFGKYGLSPFGQHLGLSTWFGGKPPYALTIDNAYLNVFLCGGVVVGIIAISLLSWLFFLIGRKGDPLLSAISLCVAIGGIMEHTLFDVFNFTALFLVQLLDESAPAPKKASGKTLCYRYGACRPLLDNYLRKVYKYANTGSLRNSLPVRNPSEVSPGDLIVYAAEDRPGEKYGHAVMVARVAVDTVSSRTAVLLLQGSTPACDIHIVANKADGKLSPWHILNPASDSLPVLSVGKSVYYESDFRHYE